jgi:glycosyltransferase involved in cell wall biosynthesis
LKRTRILHVVDHVEAERSSGYSIRTRYLTRAEAARGREPRLVSTQGRAFERLDEGIPQHGFAIPRPRLATLPFVMGRWARAIERCIREHGIQLVHAHSGFGTGLVALAAARRAGIPAVYEVRGLWHETRQAEHGRGNPVEYALWDALEGRCCRRADAVIALSEGLRDRLVEHFRVTAPVALVANGVDFARFQAGVAAPAGDGPLRLGYVGSVRRLEGLDLAVEALARMDEPAELWIVGEGEERAHLAERARGLGVADRVHLPGAVPHAEVEAWYARFDVLVFPRTRSPVTEMVTPLKPLEAMALGKPVLASDVGGLRELVVDRRCLFRADDVGALVERLQAFARDPALRAEVAAAGRQRARERDWSRVIEPALALYDSLGRGRGQAA